ncbi:hypothetical protein [Vagococcus silagei]|uniref:Uncharacterized protein n=1 Tax=Vagococcus silagei TaxID=2508885 RepID=A0A4S3B726_9ENTE|nr:hypothetical protein [Vagococcus silagei]THB61613.1 hypothetical protein ESZ54_03950 [Vagococcus silagei]
MKNNLVGIVDRIKVINQYPDALVRFTLIVENKKINCIVRNKQISNQLLFLENGRTEVAVYGNYNQLQQLVIKKLTIRNPTSFDRVFAMGLKA